MASALSLDASCILNRFLFVKSDQPFVRNDERKRAFSRRSASVILAVLGVTSPTLRQRQRIGCRGMRG
jgi:hypothetical protein